MKSDNEILKMAYVFAKKHSDDPSTQTAAVLVDKNIGVLLIAANRFPNGIEPNPERLERPQKYHYIEHAERNVIYRAAREGIETRGLTMYSPWCPCTDCARAIIQAGIKKVVSHKKIMDATPERWRDSINSALAMLSEAGVEYELYDGEIGGASIMFNDAEFTP